MTQPLPGTNAIPAYLGPSTEKSSSGVAEGEGLVHDSSRRQSYGPLWGDPSLLPVSDLSLPGEGRVSDLKPGAILRLRFHHP